MTEGQRSCLPQHNAQAVIGALQQALASGEHWYLALLKAIGLWTDDVETLDGRTYRYLIAGEAFDWMALAERLCQTVDGLLPEDEKLAFLFQGRPPIEVSAEEFRKFIGRSKYRQYLNYFYGVTAEEALIQAVRDEVRKEKLASGLGNCHDDEDEPYLRVYGARQSELLKKFQHEKGYPGREPLSITALKEFTYWLFKYRLNTCEKAKVASDTQKALTWLKKNGYQGRLRLRVEIPD